jgi:hypothetical protein
MAQKDAARISKERMLNNKQHTRAKNRQIHRIPMHKQGN